MAITMAAVFQLHGQAGQEGFTATADVKAAGGAAASAPVRVTVSRWMPAEETGKFTDAFRKGGAAGLRAALAGVPPAGSVQIGNGEPVPIRLTLDRTTDKGRLLTLITDTPIFLLGAGKPDSKPKAGYDFGIIDLEVDASGSGTGSMAPAAKIRTDQGRFIVEDYGTELVRLLNVKRTK